MNKAGGLSWRLVKDETLCRETSGLVDHQGLGNPYLDLAFLVRVSFWNSHWFLTRRQLPCGLEWLWFYGGCHYILGMTSEKRISLCSVLFPPPLLAQHFPSHWELASLFNYFSINTSQVTTSGRCVQSPASAEESQCELFSSAFISNETFWF